MISQERAEKQLVGPDRELKELSHDFGHLETQPDRPENLPSGRSSAITLQFPLSAIFCFSIKARKNNKIENFDSNFSQE